jgi:hypothetical protein
MNKTGLALWSQNIHLHFAFSPQPILTPLQNRRGMGLIIMLLSPSSVRHPLLNPVTHEPSLLILWTVHPPSCLLPQYLRL